MQRPGVTAMTIVAGPLSKAALLLLLTVSAAAAQEGNAKIADAKPGDVRVLVSTGLKASLDPVKADAEKAVGHPLVIEYGPSKGLQTQIEGGAAFEASILTRDVIDAMIAKSRIVPGSATDIGHVVDFLIDDEQWKLRDVIVDTESWGEPRTVMVSMSVFTPITTPFLSLICAAA